MTAGDSSRHRNIQKHEQLQYLKADVESQILNHQKYFFMERDEKNSFEMIEKNTKNYQSSNEVKILAPSLQNQVHVSDCASLTFFKDKILTAADDTMLMVFEKGSNDSQLYRELDQIDLEGPAFAISSDNMSTLALAVDEK